MPIKQKAYAPETAVGTGAAEPLVDEYKAAEETPSVDEGTLVEGRSQNYPASVASVDYSNETHAEAKESSNLEGPDTGAGDFKSTGEDLETRRKDDDTVAGASVGAQVDDAEVNSKAEDVRPEAPQAAKRTRKSKEEQ